MLEPKSIHKLNSSIINLIYFQARDYTMGRNQFGRPLAANQLIQKVADIFPDFLKLIKNLKKMIGFETRATTVTVNNSYNFIFFSI